MKRFSQLFEAKTIEIQEDSVNYLTVDQLNKYLEIADKFISPEAKEVCKWLIDNNKTYIKDLSTGDTDNAIVDFFNKGLPKEASLKSLYSNISKIYSSGRILEIPTLMTKEQFDSIIDKTASPDEIIMDLTTEKGRTEIVKKYEPLVHKITNSWLGKTSFDRDDIYAFGMKGLVYAMDTYGKKSNKQKKKEELTGEEVDISKYKSYTFLQYAAQMIRVEILEATKNFSHLVRIPISRQKKEKEEKGYIAKSNSVSGDRHLGGKDGEEGKTLFDLVGGMENPGKSIDRQEINDLWDQILKTLEDKFGPKTMDIFKNHFGFGLENGEKKLSGKEMAKKYGYSSPSSITAEIAKVINFIKKDKKMFQKFVDIFELMQEAKHDEDEYEDDGEPIYLSTRIMEDKMFGLNNIDGDE